MVFRIGVGVTTNNIPSWSLHNYTTTAQLPARPAAAALTFVDGCLILRSHTWGIPKFGVPFWGPYYKDMIYDKGNPTIWGTILGGPLIFATPTMAGELRSKAPIKLLKIPGVGITFQGARPEAQTRRKLLLLALLCAIFSTRPTSVARGGPVRGVGVYADIKVLQELGNK